uniref:Uncharacterized protein n=1 Tax=Grammatophora oceanica TaxID=210454 RepID=A0A7S1YJA5_9STRA|mmetsp:Transcript_5645/g.7891  ORF Transcript_5645/g.7891 Transcript_5645/m.7891 type:complete len:662 (+) Transcript_5645:162-2147(+)
MVVGVGVVVEIGDESSAYLLRGRSLDLSDAAFSSEEENVAVRDEQNTGMDEVEVGSHSSRKRRNLLAKLKSNLRKRRSKRFKAKMKEPTMDMSSHVMMVRSISSPPDLGYHDTESLLSDDDFSLSHNKHGNFGDVFRRVGDDATRDGPADSSPLITSSRRCTSFNETLSTVSSNLTNSSVGTPTKRRESLLKHWKSNMRKSLRKVVGLETEWELERQRQQIKHVKLQETGGLETIETNALYVYPEAPKRLPPSRRRVKSVFKKLRVPSLSDDEVTDETTTDAQYPLNFELDSQNHVDLDQHGLATPSNLSSSQRNVYVSFDKDCAQLVLTTEESFDDSEFHPSAGNQSCIDDEDDSIPSDEGDEILNADSSSLVSELSESPPPLGATFDHPAAGLELQKSSSSEGGPLGIPCSHPAWNRRKDDECYGGSAIARVRQQRGQRKQKCTQEGHGQQDIWSQVVAPPMDGDGNMTDHPPSPIKTIRTKLWDGLSDSDESEITMSDIFCAGSVEQVAKVDALKVLRTRVTMAGASPVPFDEAVADGRPKRPFPRTTPRVPGLKPRPTVRSPPPRSKSLSSFLMDALYHNDEEKDVVDGPDDEVELYTSSSTSPSPLPSRPPPRCHCVKCAARFVYQDLLNCSAAPTPTRRRAASSPQVLSPTAAYI